MKINLKKINLKKAKDFLAMAPRKISEHTFLAFLFLLILVFILTAWIFYGYKAAVSSPVTTGEQLKFDQKNYQRVLQEWQSRNERFRNAEPKQYQNPFLY